MTFESSTDCEDMLMAWGHGLSLRDGELHGHSERVEDLTVRLARIMGIPESEIVHIRRGALMHDVGKMGISDMIYKKPGRLTDDERLQIHEHPRIGYELLEPVEWMKGSLDIIHCHHERWDGSGYPRGLKGAQIPLAARIVAITDVFDAMTSTRPYREPFSTAFVLNYIAEQSNILFDPGIVNVFLAIDWNQS